jgi:ElaA protein
MASENNNNIELEWKLKEFEELSTKELYFILQLRTEIFVVEQKSICNDLDNKDLFSAHLMCWKNGTLIAYARIIPPGISYQGFASIGRIVNKQGFRGLGIGKELVQRAIIEIQRKFPEKPIRISGQLYLKKFYESFGFEQTSDIYIEDCIDHIQLTKY